MKVEIWSDVVCPFCYLGKRKFEKALERFSKRDEVEVLWHSFQLDPATKSIPGKDLHDYLAAKYGRSREWAKEANDDITARAKEEGLEYKLDEAIPVNTFDAHRLIHLAKSGRLQAEAEERLFHAYFSEGKDLSDHKTLAALGADIGMDKASAESMLESSDYSDAVRGDTEEAEALGIHAVPFFVFNRKYAVSGAQPTHLFLETLQQVWEEEHSAGEELPAVRFPKSEG